MKSEYKRDMNHNYLVLYGENEIDTSAYQVRMLVGNVIPSLLKCRIQGMDGNFVVYYDITSRQSLLTFYEDKKFGQEDLQLIFGEFIRAMEDTAEYLMDPSQLVIMPEYMFLEVEKKEIYFCLMPGYRKEVREQFRELTEYILPKIDHEDAKAVMIGYGVYRRALEDSFHLEYIKEELYRARDGENGKNAKKSVESLLFDEEKDTSGVGNVYGNLLDERKTGNYDLPDAVTGDDLFADTDEAFFRNRNGGRETRHKQEEQQRESVWKKVLGFGVGIVVLGVIILAKMLGYLPGLGVEVILGTVLVGMGAGMLVYIVIKKKKSREKETNAENNSDRYRGKNGNRAGNKSNRNGKERNKECRNKEFENKDEWDRNDWKSEKERRCSEGQKDIWEPDRREMHSMKVFEERKEEPAPENCGETVVLSMSMTAGPASLVSREPGELATIFLEKELTVIGKLKTASDAVIDLPTVSRIHAKVRIRDGEYYLTDLNSRNGTSVNGRLLRPDEEYCMQNEDEVDFAQARYVFLR